MTSIVRLISLKTISDSMDPTFDNVGAASWSAIECNTGIICACLPTLKPLISKLAPGLLSTLNGSHEYRSEHMSITRRTTTWNDGSTLGAPSEDPEYGAGDPEQILELVPSRAAKYARGWSKDDKNKGLGVPDITEITGLKDSEYTGHHQHTVSETSVYSRH